MAVGARDAFSRRVVAWETSAHADADLVLTSLEYALASREVTPGELVHHADHGTRYTSIKLTTRLVRAGVQASMGSVGDSFDDALAENLWMLIKTECIRGRTFATRAEANLALFEYIDGFFNPRRIQKRLGYLSPRGASMHGWRPVRIRGGIGAAPAPHRAHSTRLSPVRLSSEWREVLRPWSDVGHVRADLLKDGCDQLVLR
ncbi:transposase [Streptomyces sp. NPDC002143]